MPVVDPITPTASLPKQPPQVAWPTAAWPVADATVGAADERQQLLDTAFPAGGNVDETGSFGQSLAFVAVQGGQLVDERYGPTADAEEQLISWSMAKSMTQTFIGLAHLDGLVALADRAPVPEWADASDPRHAITIEQLLHMVPGTTFVEDYVDDATSHCLEMLFGEGRHDMAAYVAALPAAADPGTTFNYSSGTTNLLTGILGDLVGRGDAFDAWARSRLFEPLGIDVRLTFDDRGTWVGSSYAHASARDFAKFGLLYLRDGVWDGTRILPAGWVDHARTLQARNDEGVGYGAHWWLWPQDEAVFYAAGYETQRILVDPTRDLVLVRLGKTEIDKAPAVDEWIEAVRQTFPTI